MKPKFAVGTIVCPAIQTLGHKIFDYFNTLYQDRTRHEYLSIIDYWVDGIAVILGYRCNPDDMPTEKQENILEELLEDIGEPLYIVGSNFWIPSKSDRYKNKRCLNCGRLLSHRGDIATHCFHSHFRCHIIAESSISQVDEDVVAMLLLASKDDSDPIKRLLSYRSSQSKTITKYPPTQTS